MQEIQEMDDGWWGDTLDAREALIILLDHELGVELYWKGFPQEVVDLAINQYNAHCSGGVWSTECLNGFWGYSEVIREVDLSPYGSDRLKNPGYAQQLTTLADGILNQTVESQNKALTHYGNGYGDIADILTADYDGNQRYSSYLSESGPNSVFVIQTYLQHCRTGTLTVWNGIEKNCG